MMNRRSFLRALGLGPVYAVGGVALFKSLPAPARYIPLPEHPCYVYASTRLPHQPWHEYGWSDKRGFYEDTIV